MPNARVLFLPTRNPITPTPDPAVFYELNFTLLQFNHDTNVEARESYTLSGAYTKSVYNVSESYSCQVLEDGYTDENDDPLGDDAMVMFLQSVRAGETFYISNLDDSDNLLEVQLTSRWTRQRVSAVDVDKFRYQFTVREVLQ